ncbi:MAG: 50S ribosomal protein L4 [Bdellovibrionales bacterium]|nr:50S ribosomal protein L4 [Bdellovibrionales bacterium]
MDKVVGHKVIDMKGKEVGSIDLHPEVFGVKVKESLVHDTVRWQLAKRRSGTHKALTRAEMSGGGRKPWKQKGTGNARAGSNTSPVWVGGGVSHGPRPRSYEFRLSKRARRQALCSVLTDKVRKDQLRVLDSLSVETGKTKDMASVLQNVGVGRYGAVIVVDELGSSSGQLVKRAAQNLGKALVLPVSGVNVYDLLRFGHVVVSRDSVKALEERLTLSKSSGIDQ